MDPTYLNPKRPKYDIEDELLKSYYQSHNVNNYDFDIVEESNKDNSDQLQTQYALTAIQFSAAKEYVLILLILFIMGISI